MAGELREDPKEIAEHVMLLDLARNDVGRVVEFGSERVDEQMVPVIGMNLKRIDTSSVGSIARE